MCNNKEFFDAVYSEMASLDVMRAAFLYFSQRDISTFDYRKYPKTRILEQLKACSDNIDLRFCKYLLTECLTEHRDYIVNEMDIFEEWRMFTSCRGLEIKRDSAWLCCCMESTIPLRKNEDAVYVITPELKQSIVAEYF